MKKATAVRNQLIEEGFLSAKHFRGVRQVNKSGDTEKRRSLHFSKEAWQKLLHDDSTLSRKEKAGPNFFPPSPPPIDQHQSSNNHSDDDLNMTQATTIDVEASPEKRLFRDHDDEVTTRHYHLTSIGSKWRPLDARLILQATSKSVDCKEVDKTLERWMRGGRWLEYWKHDFNCFILNEENLNEVNKLTWGMRTWSGSVWWMVFELIIACAEWRLLEHIKYLSI